MEGGTKFGEMYNSKIFWLIASVVAIYFYFKCVVYAYWKRRGFPFQTPAVPVGNLWPVISHKMSIGEFVRDSYRKFKQHPYHGIYIFHSPFLFINDPELIRIVLTKEFWNFSDRGLYLNDKVDPLAGHLFFLPGERWKNLRTRLSPTFTSSKMKQMFFILKECGDQLIKCLDESARSGEIVDVKDIISRYSTDIISSVAFGWNCNSLKDPQNDFRVYGKKSFDPHPVKNMLGIFAPIILDVLGISFNDKDATKFFVKSFEEMVKYRRANNIVRKDFMNLLMELMKTGYVENDADKSEMEKEAVKGRVEGTLTMIEAAAQAFVFFNAGFETSSSTVSYCLYELAQHPEVQDQLREEIDEVLKEHGGLTYESVAAMTYLDKVVSETLRKYPSLPLLNRICVSEFDVPSHDLKFEKGTKVIIPVMGLHWDPAIYPDPEKFDPERFDKENVSKRHPYAYLPFGEGPRYCIGKRFGLTQTKVALISALSCYRFSPCPKTEISIKFCPGNVVLFPANGLHLRVETR